jgi:hypothetical protein
VVPRIIHDDNILDWLGLAAVHRVLAEAGIDIADLGEAAA